MCFVRLVTLVTQHNRLHRARVYVWRATNTYFAAEIFVSRPPHTHHHIFCSLSSQPNRFSVWYSNGKRTHAHACIELINSRNTRSPRTHKNATPHSKQRARAHALHILTLFACTSLASVLVVNTFPILTRTRASQARAYWSTHTHTHERSRCRAAHSAGGNLLCVCARA